MTGFLLDRDVLGEVEDPHGNPNVRQWIGATPNSQVFVSALTVMEGRKGLARLRARAASATDRARATHAERLFEHYLATAASRVLPVDRAVAERWGEMLALREANTMDAGVAATAFVHGLVVATRNRRHFRGRGVPLLDPFKADPRMELP